MPSRRKSWPWPTTRSRWSISPSLLERCWGMGTWNGSRCRLSHEPRSRGRVTCGIFMHHRGLSSARRFTPLWVASGGKHMRHHAVWFAPLTLVACLALPVHAQWVSFTNETTLRMPTGAGLNDPALSTIDNQEKSFAFGDVDMDGDLDLVCVRKQPFTSPGRRRNVLFMNEGLPEGHAIHGVLVDRTALYASASDAPPWDDPQVPGGEQPDQGFLTPTNDRDVVLVDVNNDTWLDVVTATSISDDAPHQIGHPRVYINLGEIDGAWQGFRFEVGRIPPMLSAAGVPGKQPRFCGVTAGDLTGDGYPDLVFGDYDSS